MQETKLGAGASVAVVSFGWACFRRIPQVVIIVLRKYKFKASPQCHLPRVGSEALLGGDSNDQI